MSEGNGWTLVVKSKPKRNPRNKKKPINISKPSSTLLNHRKSSLNDSATTKYENVAHKKSVIVLDSTVLSSLDCLSLMIYNVLHSFEHALPASAIKKEVNALIEDGKCPPYLDDIDKKSQLKSEYTKKDIGWALYDGPLSRYMYCRNTKVPRLWRLIYQDVAGAHGNDGSGNDSD